MDRFNNGAAFFRGGFSRVNGPFSGAIPAFLLGKISAARLQILGLSSLAWKVVIVVR
jgi:hypothetical protein